MTIPKEIRTTVVMACAVVLFCFAMAFWLILHNAGNAARSAAGGRVAAGQSRAAENAIAVQDKLTRANEDTNAVTRQNQESIANAENADQDAGDVGRRLSIALCSRRMYQQHPDCINRLR